MASTTLFAPQVRAVQPAFIYQTELTKANKNKNNYIGMFFAFNTKTTIKLNFDDSNLEEIEEIEWGDGSKTLRSEITKNQVKHEYADSSGIFLCKLKGKITKIFANIMESSSTTDIEYQAARQGLRALIVDGSVEEIEGAAFSACANLKYVYIGQSVKRIGNNGFDGCVNLEWLVFNAKNCFIESEIYIDGHNVARSPFTNCGSGVTDGGFNLVIGEDVEKINSKMFKSYLAEQLNSGKPSTNTDDHVYVYIKKIINYSKKLTKIGEYAFGYAKINAEEDSIIETVIPFKRLAFNDNAFENSSFENVEEIVNPLYMEDIEESFILPAGTFAPSYAIKRVKRTKGCPTSPRVIVATLSTSLENETIILRNLPGVYKIDWGDGNIEDYNGDGYTEWSHTYKNSNTTYICKIYGVYEIGKDGDSNGSFSGTKNLLTKIQIHGPLKTLHSDIFNSCENLTEIVLPNSITSIGTACFSQTKIENCFLSNGMTCIESYNSGITNWIVPENIKLVSKASNFTRVYYLGNSNAFGKIVTGDTYNTRGLRCKDDKFSIVSVNANESYDYIPVYFKLSDYNNINNNIKYVFYSIIDPNKASTWGTNSVLNLEEGSIRGVEKFKLEHYDGQTKEYFIRIPITKLKTLTYNQFYQVQLYLSDLDNISETTVINESYLLNNEKNISLGSQATLVRPISMPKIVFDNKNLTNPFIDKITGWVEYENNITVETIDSCYCQLTYFDDNGNAKVRYQSPVIKNSLGVKFEIPIKDYEYTDGQTYAGNLFYITKNGYDNYGKDVFSFNFPIYNKNTDESLVLETDPEKGCIQITTPIGGSLQKKEIQDTGWTILKDLEDGGSYKDFLIENLNEYQYRVVYEEGDGKVSMVINDAPVKLSFEDIFLSDKDTMLIVKYNPNISGFKYIVQEATANTLGGKYPIVRKNGDTKYRQFNLSGTLYIDASTYNQEIASNSKPSGYDNWSTSVKTWFNNDKDCSLYIKDEKVIKDYTKKERLERQARELAINFLTNGNPKLLRASEEGNMIVHLSNISFTPNKQLGRAVWDFSATVTEICEYNIENVNKYKLNDGREFKSALKRISLPSN